MSLRPFITALCALALTACASSANPQMSQISTQPLGAPDPVALAQIGSDAEYRIGPFDGLDIAVYQAPDLTRSVEVDAAGFITMPLIGQVPAAGRTARELQTQLADKLSEKYMQSPQVTVAVREFASQRVTVDGAVVSPGVYAIRGRTTLLQVVAMAKGGDPRYANEHQVVIFRTVNGQRMAARFDLTDIRAGVADDPEVFGNDVVVVDRSDTRSVLRDVIGTLPIVSVFRPLLF